MVGNLPALLRPGPSSLGICFMMLSEAKNASYFFAATRTQFKQIIYSTQDLYLVSLQVSCPC